MRLPRSLCSLAITSFAFLLVALLSLQMPALAFAAGTVHVKLKVTNVNSMIYENDNLEVSSTQITDTNGTLHTFDNPTALGALIEGSKAGDFDIEVTDSVYGLYLWSVAGIAPQGWDGWMYSVNGNSPWDSIANYAINEGDQINVYYSIWPYKVEANKTKARVNEEITLTAHQYDSPTNSWLLYPEASVKVGTEEKTTGADGRLTVSFAEEGKYDVYLLSLGWQNSPTLTLEISEQEQDTPTLKPVSSSRLKTAVKNAVSYLKRKINSKGIIENIAVSNWAVMAFAANKQYSQSISNQSSSLFSGIENYKPQTLNDYSRHVLSILATGGNPYKFNGRDFISKIKSYYKNGQMGDPSFVNDDIFASLALLAAGEKPTGTMVKNSLKFILKNQNGDGGFSYAAGLSSSDIDSSAAGLQLLAYAKKRGFENLDNSITKARAFIKNSQNDDGGFPYMPSGTFTNSNVASTSWAIMALKSAGLNINNVKASNGATPYHYLIDSQKNNGSFPWKKGETSSNLITAWTVPALLGVSWPIKMEEYKGSTSQSANQNNSNQSTTTTTTTTTTSSSSSLTESNNNVDNGSTASQGNQKTETDESPAKKTANPANSETEDYTPIQETNYKKPPYKSVKMQEPKNTIFLLLSLASLALFLGLAAYWFIKKRNKGKI